MSSDKKGEYEPILEGADSISDTSSYVEKTRRSWPSPQKISMVFLIAHIALLSLNVSLLALNVFHFKQHSEVHYHDSGSEIQDPWCRRCKNPNCRSAVLTIRLQAPARDIAEYSLVKLDMTATTPNPYWGEPRPELDAAWAEITRGSTSYISEADMIKMNKTSIQVKNGKGYVGYFAVYHQLHCLKNIFRMNYPDYYSDRFSDEHFQHCMEVLRQTIMCRADLTVNTMRWEPNAGKKFVGNAQWDRKCINWDSFHAWTSNFIIPEPLSEQMMDMRQIESFGPRQ